MNTEGAKDVNAVSGKYVLHTLIAEFTVQVERKVDALIGGEKLGFGSDSTLSKDLSTKSLQRGEDPQFDQLLSSLGCVAEHCLPSLLDTLFKWYEHQLPNLKKGSTAEASISEGKQHKSGTKSKSDSIQVQQDERTKCRETAVEFVFCLVLIEVLRQLPVHPLPDRQIRSILTYAFNGFYRSANQKGLDATNVRIVADLYAEAIGVLAQTKFQAVRNKFMYELLKDKEAPTSTVLSLIMGMKFFRVKMYPIEDFEASFRFLQELANYSLDVKNREIKHALAGLFVEILVPVAAAVKTEVNVPVLRDFVDSLYPTCLELSKRQKNKLAMYPLVTCLLCVSQKQFFLNNWHIFLDTCLSTLKNRDQKLSRVALESLYRLLWVYIVRIKCESNTATQSRLQSIVKGLFPVGSRSVVPKDTPLNIFVKIIQFIAQERLDFAMKEIVLDLLSISLSGSRSTKSVTVHPERMNIGLRAFLVITDGLQQKDGAPPMPSTVGVMPSGNTLRVKKTFLNKTLTEDEARTIGVSHYHKHVQKALNGILLSLDNQVGQRMMMTNSQLTNKDPQDLLTGEHKPKIELFRTCIAAIPRLMPAGMSHSDLLDMLSRLTVHMDEELRGRAFSALQSFAVDFPTLREEAVATFLSFVLKQVSDAHHVLLDASLKMLASLITTWKNNATNSRAGSAPSSRCRHKSLNNSSFTNNSSSVNLSNGKCVYAPIINRVEGFALVLLCSSRSMTRKLACHILKEIRFLAQSVDYGKQDDKLCLDVLDKLCPEVARDVIQQNGLHQLEPTEMENVLTVASKEDMAALVECSCNWHDHEGMHPWIVFMSAFIEAHRLPKFCTSALSYSWPDIYIRLSQIQQHIEPAMTVGNKKIAPVPARNDQNLILWTNYLVFACKCSPSNASIKMKQTKESAIAAGTPDWQVALTRDSERITALPSSLFQRLITQLRAEGSPAYREAVVIGLGSTSVVAFLDLMNELLTIVHEATEIKKQENPRRKRKRDHVRAVLAKVFAKLATHRVLSEGILAEPGRPHGANTLINCKKIVQDYIGEMRSFLDQENVSTTSFASQSTNTFVGSVSGAMSPSLSSSSIGTINELRLYFAEMVIQLIRHFPLDQRSQLLSPETRKQLFMLYGSWCGKIGKSAAFDQSCFNEKVSDASTLLHAALRAECAVLCCGPVFDKNGFSKNGYLFQWLEQLLDCPNEQIHSIGREAVVLLLHYNAGVPELASWLIDKCYTGMPLLATGCFLGIATHFANSRHACDCIAMICLALFKLGDHDPQVSQTAEHFLVILLSRYLSEGDDSNNAGDVEKNIQTNVKKEGILRQPISPGELRYLSQANASLELARSHPEITIPVLSEIFSRFPTASEVGRRQMLEFMKPLLQNVELVCLASRKTGISGFDKPFRLNLDASTLKSNSSQNRSWLPNEGWGSAEATLHVLNNLMYITTCYHQSFGTELEKCWVTLCETWPQNLLSAFQYLLALHSVHINDRLSRAAKLVISYLARDKCTRLTRLIVNDCQIAEPVSIVIELSEQPPYYKVVDLNPETLPPVVNTPETTDSVDVTKRASSVDDVGKDTNKEESKLHSTSAPATHADRSTSERADPTRPNILSNQKAMVSGNASLNLDSYQRDATVHQLERFLQWRVKVESSESPEPLLMPDKGVMLPLHDFLYFEKVPLLRSSMACMLLSELVMWHGINIHWQTHLPTVLLSLILNMDQDVGTSVPYCCQQLLAHIILKLCPHFVPTQVACSVISCKLDSTSHNLVSKPISSLIRSDSVEKLSKAGTPSTVGGVSFPRDSGVSSPSSSSSLRGTRNLVEGGEHSSSTSEQSSGVEMGDPGIYGEQGQAPASNCSEYAGNLLLRQLFSRTIQTWNREDVAPKNMVIKSTDQLTTFVQRTVSLLDSQLPIYKVKDRLGKEALCFFRNTSSKHHASRSLQVFRALKLPLPPDLLPEVIGCLLGCIADGNDAESQSHFIEILLTLLHACDTLPLERNDNDSRKRSKSFTPDRSWRFSADGTGTVASTPAMTKVPSSTSSCAAPQHKHGKIASSPIVGLSLLPSKPKFSVPNQAGPFDTTTPGSPKNTSLRDMEPTQSTTTRPFKKGHAHRRSGSVTLTKKMAEEVTQTSQRGMSESGLKSPPLTRHEQHEVCLDAKKAHNNPICGENEGDAAASGASIRAPNNSMKTATIHKTQSADAVCTYREHRSNDDDVHLNSRPYIPSLSSTEEWKNMLAQLFWVGVAILESDYEHEFLLAVKLIEKVLSHVPLGQKEARFRIEKYLSQIKWGLFPGLQCLLLKGLTSITTCDASFRLISSLTTMSHLSLVCGNLREGNGFSMNIIALLPHLVDHFGDPDQACLESAQNIAQVCVEDYSDKKKLQSLAHVMSLYSNRTYGKPCLTWVSVVCKYVHETFPDTIRQQLTFLLDMLEKGHASTHQSCLRIIYSMLSLSEILSTTAPNDVKFSQDLLRAISKFINNTKVWKEALNILKLAVSRCSAIAVPTDSGIIPTSSSLSGDMDRLELPGRTLTFEYDVTDTPIVGKLKTNDNAPSKITPSVSLSYHTSTTSPPTSGWKRPHLSQRRTHERILCILPICGQHIPNQSKGGVMLSPEPHIAARIPDMSLLSGQTDEELSEENVFDQGEKEQDEKSLEEQESGVDDMYVLRNFDFLDDIEDNEDRFVMIHHNSSNALPELETGMTEEDPVTCNLTPMHREASMEIDQSIIVEEDEEFEHEQTAPEKCLESEESSISHTSSAQSISFVINGNVSNGEEDSLNKTVTSETPVKNEKTKSALSLIAGDKNSDSTTQLVQGSSAESLGSGSVKPGVKNGLNSMNMSIPTSEIIRPSLSEEFEDDSSSHALSSEGSCSDDENSDSPTKTSLEDLSEDQTGIEMLLNGKHKSLHRVYSDIPHTPPPPPSNISSDPVDIPIVSPPPPVDDLLSNVSSVHSEPSVVLEPVSTEIPLRQVVSEQSFSRTSTRKRNDRLSSPPMLTSLPSGHSASSLYQPEDNSHQRHAKVSSFSAMDVLFNPPPWNAPSPLSPEMESRWKLHIESLTTDEDESAVSKTFDLFPVLYRILCYDFSKLSKDGCKHLGSQLSKIAEHFSSMVEQLPSQIQCPTCLATKGTVDPVLEQLKFGVLELQEHLDSYNTKRKNTLQCLDMVKELKSRQKNPDYTGKTTASNSDSESVAHKTEDDIKSDDSSSTSSSHSPLTSPPAVTNPAMLKCQLELCRLLYKLHFQLLLLLKSFNKLIQLVTASSPDNKNITEEMNMLRKKLLSVENVFQDQDWSTDNKKEMLSDVKSMTRDDAEQALAASISSGNVHAAIEQLLALRELWPPDVFGGQGDCASDCLTKIYFKHLEDRSTGRFYAVLGPDDVTHGVCEKLMEVNSQIQQSLRSLAVIPPPSDRKSSETDTKASTMKRTLL